MWNAVFQVVAWYGANDDDDDVWTLSARAVNVHMSIFYYFLLKSCAKYHSDISWKTVFTLVAKSRDSYSRVLSTFLFLSFNLHGTSVREEKEEEEEAEWTDTKMFFVWRGVNI